MVHRAFTDSVFADRVALQPKAPPSRSATHMPQVKQRMREVKAQLREERCVPVPCRHQLVGAGRCQQRLPVCAPRRRARKHAARTARKELEHKWDSHVQSRNQLVVTTELAGAWVVRGMHSCRDSACSVCRLPCLPASVRADVSLL